MRPEMNSVNYADEYMCPPFKDNCVEPNFDPSIETFIGMVYSSVASVFLWMGIFLLAGGLF